MNRKLSKWHFWTFFIFFNLTFFPLFLVGLLGQPRRVFEYATNLQTLNDISSISAYFLGASFFFFIVNFVWSIYLTPHPAPPNPWNSLGLEWQTPTPVPWFNFEHIPVVLNDPYHYGEPDARTGGRPRAGRCRPSARRPARSDHEELGDRGGGRRRSASPDPVRGVAMAQQPGRQPAVRELPAAPGDAGGDRLRAAGPGGSPLDRRPAPDRDLGLRLRRAGLRLLLPALGQQRGPLASEGHHGPHRRPARPSSPSPWPAPSWSSSASAASAANETLDWQVAGWTAVLGGLLAIGLQIWQLTELPFFPGSSGYASCFIGWAVDEHRLGARRHLLDRDHPGPGDPPAPRHRPGRRGTRARPCPWPASSGPT